MSDLIDRSAAIKVVEKWFSKIGLNPDILIDSIASIPTVEAEPRWISVTERLPEKYGWYLCTLIDGRVNTYYWNNKSWVDNVRKYMFEIYEIRGRFTGKIISPEEECVNWDDWVVAWMPLPEPYREVEE